MIALCQSQVSWRRKVSLTEFSFVCELANFQEAAGWFGSKKALSCKRVKPGSKRMGVPAGMLRLNPKAA